MVVDNGTIRYRRKIWRAYNHSYRWPTISSNKLTPIINKRLPRLIVLNKSAIGARNRSSGCDCCKDR